jgi:CRISPR-associated endoribonuclease Cas6
VKIRQKRCDKNPSFFCIKKRVVKLKLEGYRKETQKEYLKLPAYEGIFELEGHPEVLKKLYQKGLGQRTAEGFGMVEVYTP